MQQLADYQVEVLERGERHSVQGQVEGQGGAEAYAWSPPEKIVLTITPTGLGRLEITDDLGRTHHRAVTLVDLLGILDRSLTVESLDRGKPRRLNIGPVPNRVLALSVLEAPRSLQVELVGWIPPFEHGFAYGDRVYPIRLPALVYKALWNGKERRLDGLMLSVAGIGAEVVTPESPVYRWPFSNAYEGGGVCWPTMNKVELGLEEVPRLGVLGFLSVVNNADLFGTGVSHNGPRGPYEQFLEVVSEGGLKQEWLIPHGTTAAAGQAGATNPQRNGGS